MEFDIPPAVHRRVEIQWKENMDGKSIAKDRHGFAAVNTYSQTDNQSFAKYLQVISLNPISFCFYHPLTQIFYGQIANYGGWFHYLMSIKPRLITD